MVRLGPAVGAAWPLALFAAWLTAPPAGASEPAGEVTAAGAGQRAQNAPRPKLTLVLSGGGARGAAHIGVLKVLEELHVPVDMVVGTSMGSIVGGLYAAGYDPSEIERILASMNWKELFIDHADREQKTFRRKQDDAIYLIPTRLRLKGWKPYLPPAFLGGQRLELMLRSLEIEATGESDFDRVPIPFRAVAADLTTGEAVILDHGSLATSMRASMSVAGMFAPVEIDGRLLVDGGAAANLPVGIAQGLGAVRIIAVDITSPLYTKEQLGSVFSIFSQMSSFITYGNRVEDLKRLRPGDVLVQPDLGDMTFTDFERWGEAVGIGEAAARALAGELRRFAVDDAAWTAFETGHTRRPRSDLVVDRVRLENSSWVADQVVQDRLDVETETQFDGEALRETLLRLHALDYFGLIRGGFERQDGVGTLSIETPKKPYGRNSLQFGVSFRDDFEGENSWSLAMRHLVLAADRRGGEWENTMQIGDTALLRSEFYQPFDYGMQWFVAPWGQIRRESLTLWEDGQAVAESRIDRNEGHLDFGRVFGAWGEARLGPFYAYEQGDIRIGSPSIEPYKEHSAGGRFLFRIDTRDASVFPRHGASVEALYQQSFDSWGADADSQRAYVLAGAAMTAGRVTILPSLEGGTLITGPSTLDSQVRLGGFLRLSGLGQDELLGDRGGLARIMAYVQLRRFDLGALSSSVYGGLSLEAGNVYAAGDPITRGSLRHGASIFLGAQTVLGPVFVGYGLSDGGRDRVYLIIGHRF